MEYSREELRTLLDKAEWKEYKSTGALPKRLQITDVIPEVVPTVLKTSPDAITVMCVRFGTRYGRDYVEKLRNMVSRHLTVPYEFVCLTDDPTPIDGVRLIVQANAGYTKGWWHKVHMFDPGLGISGRILYFDLDIVIHNNIDKLVTVFKDDFLSIQDFNRKFNINWNSMNSSAMCWRVGTVNHIWTKFIENPREAQRLHGDQDWIWKVAKDRIKFWPKEWIMSYKWEVRSRDELINSNGNRRFRTVESESRVHPQCSVTVFHGDPKPPDIQDKFVVDNWR